MSDTLEQIRKALVDTMSPRVIPQQHLPAVVRIMRELAKGRPLSVHEVARAAMSSGAETQELTRLLEAAGMVELDGDGRVIGMIITLRSTRHRLCLGETRLYTWCAIDTLFMPAVLRRDARVESTCPETGTRIRLAVGTNGVEQVDPPGAYVSLVAPGVTSGVPSSCCGAAGLTGAQGTFCGNVRFFGSQQAAEQWLERHDGAAVVSVEDAYKLARSIWIEPLLAADA